MRGYAAKRRNRYYAVIYEGIDPITGRERRRWHPAGTDREEAGVSLTVSQSRPAPGIIDASAPRSAPTSPGPGYR